LIDLNMPGSPPTLVPGEPEAFLNREDQVQRVLDHFDALHADPSHFKVLELLGLGGMGKTTLLKQLRKLAANKVPSRRALLIPLHGEKVSGETAPLQAIRDEFGFECLLFDTALLTYWSVMAPQFDRVQSTSLGRSLPVQALQAGSGIAGFPLPFGFALEAFKFASRKLTEARRYEAHEFELIDALRDVPEEIQKLLPQYLALDIARAIQPETEIILLYDGYEKQSEDTRDARAPWLRSFIATLGRGVHVIGTREPLRWNEPNWTGILEPLSIDEFPEKESRELIQARLGEIGSHFENRLMEASQRIPFYLETVINTYEIHVKGGQSVQLDDLPLSPDDSVARLLEHLTGTRKKLAVALATVQTFDVELFECLVDGLRLQIDAFEFEDIVSRYFIEDVSPGLHKTHDILTEFVRRSIPDSSTRKNTLLAATRCLLRRSQVDRLEGPDRLLALFGAVVSAWYSVDEPPEDSVEMLIDACYLMYDAGYWTEIGSMPLAPPGRAEHPVSVAMEFFAAISSRRGAGVDRALELFEGLRGRSSLLGRHQQSVEMEAAYLRELAGDYERARTEFRKLEENLGRFDPTSRLHIRSRLYLADMQTMDGELLKGSRLLLETSEKVDLQAKVDWAELVRHRGHTFRFSFLMDDAARLYREAIREVEEAPALCGKLQTNLAETLCWCNPQMALKEADLSIELNRRFANRIELAKCDAARGIALARLGSFDDATEAIEAAAKRSKEVGYPAGTAFALQAEAIQRGLERDDKGLDEAIAALRDAVRSLDTYAHLLVAPLLLTGDAKAFAEASADVEWIEAESLEERLGNYLVP
jgi:tetratricopeptide (TPR) repeat protein